MVVKVKCRFPKLCKHPHTEDGECDKFCSFNTKKVKTNADRIRAMTDEELAELITKRQGVTHHNEHFEGTKLLWLDWLKEEVDDGRIHEALLRQIW